MMCTRLFLASALALAAGCASTDSPPPAASSVAVSGDVLSGSYVDTKGQGHDLAGVLKSGKPVALVFWQPWCGACVAEAPTVIAAHEKLGNKMEFYGVVSGPDEAVDEADVSKVIFDTGMTYPTIRDRDLRLTKGLGVEIQPTIVILDPAGTVSYKAGTPPADWH